MKEENVKEWLRLSESGHVAEAEEFYYDTLFRDVIDEFCDRNKIPEIRCNVLFSILGYSPEPIILTQRALNPEIHIIFTTDIKDTEATKKIRDYLGKYLTSEFKIIEIHDNSFNGIYTCLKDQMVLYPSQDYVIDITGGKKSMVATAAIFGRDYNCNIVYVDYDQYLSQIRKPLPGSEVLNYVYTPSIDLPEITFFSQINKDKNSSQTTTSSISVQTSPKETFYNSDRHKRNFKQAFLNIIRVFEGENGYTQRVNVKYDYQNNMALMYSPKNKFSVGFFIDSFMSAYKDYRITGKIKDIDKYRVKPVDSANKDVISSKFYNIIIAIDEKLKMMDKTLYD